MSKFGNFAEKEDQGEILIYKTKAKDTAINVADYLCAAVTY